MEAVIKAWTLDDSPVYQKDDTCVVGLFLGQPVKTNHNMPRISWLYSQ